MCVQQCVRIGILTSIPPYKYHPKLTRIGLETRKESAKLFGKDRFAFLFIWSVNHHYRKTSSDWSIKKIKIISDRNRLKRGLCVGAYLYSARQNWINMGRAMILMFVPNNNQLNQLSISIFECRIFNCNSKLKHPVVTANHQKCVPCCSMRFKKISCVSNRFFKNES